MKWLDRLATRYLAWRRRSIVMNTNFSYDGIYITDTSNMTITGNTFRPYRTPDLDEAIKRATDLRDAL